MCTLALRTMDPWSSTQWECVCVCVSSLLSFMHSLPQSCFVKSESKSRLIHWFFLRQFDWLKVTAGYLDDDYACMVRIKFDEVYVSLGIFLGSGNEKRVSWRVFASGNSEMDKWQMVFVCFYSFNGTQARRHCCLAATSCSDIFRSSWSWNPLLQPKDFTSAKIQAKLKRWDFTSQEVMLISSFCMLIPQVFCKPRTPTWSVETMEFQCRWRCRMEDRKTHPSHRHPIRVLWPLQKHLEQTNDWMWSGFVANRREIYTCIDMYGLLDTVWKKCSKMSILF